MAAKENATAIASSAPTDEKQSLNLCNNIIMSENSKKINQKNENTRIQFLFQQVNNPDYFNTVSLTELYDTVYPPKTQVIDNLLYAGVYLFAGAPKVGKSFFMAQIGYHVSKGIPLWNYAVHKGVSLYLALEDDYARLQKRLSKMFGMDGTDDFHFVTNAKNLSQGLESQLDTFIQEHPDTRLIIVDTLQKIREAGGEKFSYASDYEIVAKLKQFNAEHNVCILLVHHTRKQNADDCFDTISGTNGLLGAADGAFLMQKEKRTDNKAVLDLVGRDQQDQRLHLQFDRERCVWQLIKAETELWKEPPDPILSLISGLVNKEAPEWIGSATELIERLKLEMQPNVLTRRLNVGADRLWNEYGISYETTRSHTGRQVKFILIGK
jgi:RecA-family ATPase